MNSMIGKLDDREICCIFVNKETKEMGISPHNNYNPPTLWLTKEEAKHLVGELSAMIDKLM